MDNVGFFQESNHQDHIIVATGSTSFMSTGLQTTSTIIPYLTKHLSLLLNLKLCMFKSKRLHNSTHRCSIVEFSYFLLMTVRLETLKQKYHQLNMQDSNKPFFNFPFQTKFYYYIPCELSPLKFLPGGRYLKKTLHSLLNSMYI